MLIDGVDFAWEGLGARFVGIVMVRFDIFGRQAGLIKPSQMASNRWYK